MKNSAFYYLNILFVSKCGLNQTKAQFGKFLKKTPFWLVNQEFEESLSFLQEAFKAEFGKYFKTTILVSELGIRVPNGQKSHHLTKE